MLAIAATVLCWGTYGPLLHKGGVAMGHDSLRPFMCVGIAYFLIAVLVPGASLYFKGERGNWTAGGAPVVNSFVTVFTGRGFKQIGSIFIAGLILVVAGAVTVLVFKPGGGPAGAANMTFATLARVLFWVAVTAISWGCYGPVLHKGQMKMSGSRMRPLMCVGLAYFAIGVLAPLVLWGATDAGGQWTASGAAWSLAAGCITAIGALGIILAFNFGGKPIYVMPLVFGLAPVVNTFFVMAVSGVAVQPGPIFYAGLILVAVGAVIVLVFAPRGHGHAPAPKEAAAQPAA
jgi:hypothetical protein